MHLSEPLRLETLCGQAKVSVWTLENAFREVTSLGPHQFVKARRLSAARHALHPAEKSVKAIALSHGFAHLGYFARDYKAQFGESPSQTLAQRLR